MANINAVFGLRPSSMVGGRPNSTGYTRYTISTLDKDGTGTALAGTTSKLYTGQLVIPTATGIIGPTGDDTGGTVPVLGVFMGCEYTNTEGERKFSPYYPGSGSVPAQDAYALVADDPMQIFEISCDGAVELADVFSNAELNNGITGSDVTGLSYGVLQANTVATTADDNLRIIGFKDMENHNDQTVAGRIALVRLNNHFNLPASGDSTPVYIGSPGI